jgi:prepilin peptidase CpaA
VYVQSILLVLLSLACAVTDFRAGKIYNKLTYPSIAVGVALSFFFSPPDPLMSVAGVVGALLGYSLLYKIGGMGAGDVKLMMGIGALKGLPFVFFASFYIFCIAGLAALVIVTWKGRLVPVVKWVAGTLASTVIPGVNPPELEGGMTTMPFAPAIFLGGTFCVILEALNGQPFTF